MEFLYTDLNGRQAYLTNKEVSWFKYIRDICREAAEIRLPIEPHNHEKLKGKSREALAFIATDNKNDPLSGDTYISVDTYFIHECYAELYEGEPNLAFITMEEVLSHEFAHCFQWRHCKRHERLTQQFYLKIKEYIAKQE